MDTTCPTHGDRYMVTSYDRPEPHCQKCDWAKRDAANRSHRRSEAPKGECRYCDENKGVPFTPYHDPSPYCESGKHPHCTCDTCF